ncbi:MAG TPA: MerR family transcriptional regulator [Pirellulaceae bacterium]|nr:MerR family transcriptional regulator [Pirellulaceae bacterium]
MSAPYTAALLAELVGVNAARVRAWQRRGWLVPVEETHRLATFDFTELSVARQLAELTRAGASTRLIARKLAEIHRHFPDVARPLAELSLVLDGRKLLVRRGTGLVETSGQLRIDFDALDEDDPADEPPATIASPAIFLARQSPALPGELNVAHAAPEQLAAWAADLDEAGDLRAAAETYRAALAAGGPQPELCFQLAEVLYRAGDLAAARERYFMALELDEKELAAAAFEGTLQSHEPYPDAHYHLARVLDELSRPEEAAAHWSRFLELSPESPWADEARLRLQVD